jgi:hypothetical protein
METQGADDSVNYPRVLIEEIYEPTKHLNAVMGQVKDHKL